MTQVKNREPHSPKGPSKKDLILEAAAAFAKDRITAAEIEQIRRQLIAQFGADANTSADYIASVLADAGRRVILSTHADTEGRYEEEFHDLLHFSTLEDAERQHILRALRQTEWRIAGPKGAAAILDMKRTTLQARMRKLGIRRPV